MHIGKVYSASTHNNQIQTRQIVLPESETLPDQSLDPISVDGPLQYLFGYRCSQACIHIAISQKQNGKTAVRRSAGPLENPLEFSRFKQPQIPTETCLAILQSSSETQDARRSRPFARRAFSILRPLRVAIRARNP